MSDQLRQLIAELVALAKAENVDKAGLVAVIGFELGVAAQSSIWNADGITDPNANPEGLYRDSVLEAFKSDLLKSSFTDAAALVDTWIASIPGAELLTDPIIKQQVLTDVSYSNNVTVNPGDQGNCFKFAVTQSPLGPQFKFVENPDGSKVTIPDAMAAPQDCKTHEDVRRFFKQRVANYLEANSGPPAPGVDFSPAIYQP